MALSAVLKASINADQTTSGDLGSGKFSVSQMLAQTFVDGAGAGAVDRMFADRRSIAASGNEDLDLSGGGLTDVYGAALSFARIKAIMIKASASNENNVRLTRPSSNGVPLFLAASDGIDIPPGGCFLWMAPGAAGVAVTASTGDLINVANSGSGTSVEYEIVILGAAT